ncbi:Fic/DOC family protein [Pseudomonas sp. GCM10022186]|uniref:Fic/DOC family protein n=1 Tax=Pseudomonas sp. GCM10022186 TaxID=3252650 RepID=UPI0036148DA8
MIFDPFGDFDTAGYLRNRLQLKDLDQVKRLEHMAFEANLEEALAYLAGIAEIDYEAILRVHSTLFGDFYPWAGQDRAALVPHLAVFKGSEGDPHRTAFEHPAAIERAVNYALQLAADRNQFRAKPGGVLGNLAFAHPFLDGNGRTLLLVYMEICYRSGFAIEWAKTRKLDYLKALSLEIEHPAKGHLDSYLAPFVTEISDRDEWPELIGGINGLDGLDLEVSYESLDDPVVQQIYQAREQEKPDS